MIRAALRSALWFALALTVFGFFYFVKQSAGLQ